MQASILLLSIGMLVGVHGQSSTTGSITGTVRDPQGAAVPKAEITIVEDKTGASRTVTANDDGFYNVPSLPAGIYTVSTAPAGFKKTVTTGVDLHVNENKCFDGPGCFAGDAGGCGGRLCNSRHWT
jgi:hypothetical protein